MQKVGIIDILGSERSRYNIVYNSDEILKERIDFISDITKYNPLSTDACECAYLKDRATYYFGDSEIVDTYFKVISGIDTGFGKTERKFDISNGSVVITDVKTCSNGDIKIRELTNGLISREIYKTQNVTIEFTSIDQSVKSVSNPLNLGLYQKVGFDVVISDSDELDYYTEEQLRSMYGSQMDHIYEMDLQLSESLDEAFIWLDTFRKTTSKLVSVDIESTGLDVDMFGDDCITSVGIAYDETHSMMFPFRQKGCEYNLPIWFFSEIIDALNNLPEGCRVGTFNGKMEIESFWKERSYHVKYSSKAKMWESTDYQMYLKEAPSYKEYKPTEYVIERLKSSKSYLYYLEHKDCPNPILNCPSDVDGFNISLKLDPRRGKGIHALKTITSKITNQFWLELDLIFKGKIKFDVLPPGLIKLYAGPDPCNTIRVIKYLESQAPTCMRTVLDINHKLTYVKAENEYYGMRTNVTELENEFNIEMHEKDMLEKHIKSIMKTSGNIRSNKVKQDIFYNKLHAPVEVRTDKGEPSTSKEALKAIIKVGNLGDNVVTNFPNLVMWLDEHNLVCAEPKLSDESKHLLAGLKKDTVVYVRDGVSYIQEESGKLLSPSGEVYSSIEEGMKKYKMVIIIQGKKLGSNKYPALVMLSEFNKLCKETGALNRIKKKSHNGRVTFYIIGSGAESDRQTSDAHQYSDTMKRMILSDSDQHWLISCDYKQVELRVLAFVAGEQPLIELEMDSSIDIHRAILSLIKKKPIYLISDEERSKGKQINFGIVYGMTEYGLVMREKGTKYTKEDLIAKRNDITDFMLGMPAINKFIEDNEKEVLRDFQVKTMFNDIRRLDILRDPNITKRQRKHAIKGGNNTKIQGFAATLMKLAEIRYYKYIRDKGWDELVDCDGVMLPLVRMQLSIHDEVLISAHKSIPVPEIIKMCKICQEIPIKGAPPFFAAPAFVDNWYLGKKDKYEIPIEFRDEIIKAWNEKRINILPMDKYLDVLGEYRDSVLKDYMDDLIRKYKTVDEVSKHVDHPDLTHVLISRYFNVDKDGHMEQLDKIKLATERYMEGHVIHEEVDFSVRDENAEYLSEGEEFGKYVNFTSDGELLIEYDDEDTRAEYEDSKDEEDTLPENKLEDYYEKLDEYAVYCMNTVMIDFTKIKSMEVNEAAHQSLYQLSKKNPGSYEVVYIVGSKIIKAGFSISHVENEINEIVRKAIKLSEEEMS